MRKQIALAATSALLTFATGAGAAVVSPAPFWSFYKANPDFHFIDLGSSSEMYFFFGLGDTPPR
ncbi:hypothetical protein [Pseudorhodobacter aquimaris]|uniref:hypothetical protein n=1 Tax=Pseudorhodobacter aquimaris TaxID=687412 RepID=UPI000ADB504C|nr:hypothetical protein [Pseudorhodobacter aquimaris]